ncbi:24453_t:CDS:1, partial [Dentiscutata erythropus]
NVNCVSLCNTNTQQQRHRTTPSQVQFLENYFTTVDDFPDSNMREKISSKLNMPSKSVHIW